MSNNSLLIKGLRVKRGERVILDGVDLEIAPGEICTLMGLSGSGKSTILRSIAALQPFDAGTIEVSGFALHPGAVPRESRLKELRSRVGMVFQAHSLFEHLTALKNITLAPVHALGWPKEKAETIALELLTELGVAHRANAYPRELSGGEAQRIAIARALAPNPMILLMDEPTSALDPARRGALGNTLRELADKGRGLLIATHDVEFCEAFANRVTILSNGVVVEQGPPGEVLVNPSHQATRELLSGPQGKPAEAAAEVKPVVHIQGKGH
jgi:ABC-type polar amino acid transport system ATPase subunit